MLDSRFWLIRILALVVLVLVLVAGCDNDEPATPAPTATVPVIEATAVLPTAQLEEVVMQAEGILISELLPGLPGANNSEFVELYNAGSETADLQGWSLWYTLNGGDEKLVHEWTTPTEIPGYGHYLLVHEGRDFGLVADTFFTVSLFERRGGLILRDAAGETADSLGWGDAPEEAVAGSPVVAPTDGASVERLPGSEAGNGLNSGDNSADWVSLAVPFPQNSGSPITPLPDERLVITLAAPETVEPGQDFAYEVLVENKTNTVVTAVQVVVPLPDPFTVVQLPDESVVVDGRWQRMIDELGVGETAVFSIHLQSPLAYVDTFVRGYYVEAAGWGRTYGPLRQVIMAGGGVPIAVARELIGNVVSVEGVVTMYTGGFFAGSSSTKFYVEDDTGGIQVFADGGNGTVTAAIGDRVRVTGQITVFRDALELIPLKNSTDVEILETNGPQPEPTQITASTNETDDRVLGRLNVIEGIITAVEELAFDYQLDLLDDAGDTTVILIEKQTGVTADPLAVGNRYRVMGISEFYQGLHQLKPRLQTDIVEIFPPVLSVNMRAANSVLPGEEIVYHVTVVNHTPDPLTNLTITAVPPTENVSLLLDVAPGTPFVWTVDELAGNGESVTFEYSVIVNDNAVGMIEAPAVTAVADQWPDPAATQPFLTFIGEGVPIWAIQGPGDTSPYVRDGVTTVGVVTAVFPELQGFWIQETTSDDNPLTSAAIYVLFPEVDGLVQVGVLVQVEGTVRELFTQTTIEPPDAKGITVLSSGNELPEATPVTPLADLDETLSYYETLEGMLVQTSEPYVVAAASNRFGEYVIIPQSWGVDTLRRGENTGYFLFVDDGSTVAHDDQSTLPYAVNRGDLVSNLVGPLAYSFGYYKIEPIVMPEIVAAERPLPTFPAPDTNEFSIATFNVENLFDLVEPHPASPPRPTLDQYRTKLEKIAQTIIAMGTPTVIAVQEVENIDILESLVELDSLAEFNYQPYLLEGRDSRGIDNGYLVRGDLATVEGVSQVDGPDDLISRLPLMITVTVHLEAGDQTIILLNNHFTALSAGEEATEPQRTAQAALNAAAIEQVRINNPEALFVVMGDLNSFYDTLPLHTIQEAGLQHVYEFVEGDVLPYSYIFEGRAQTLDHILVSPELFREITAVSTLHLGTDYSLPSPDDTSARHASDHDPLVVMFSFE